MGGRGLLPTWFIMAQRNLSDAVLRLLELGKPTFVNGRWRKPVVSRREMNDIKKYMVNQGEAWPEKKLRDRGGDKPFKLTKWERGREERYTLHAAKVPFCGNHRFIIICFELL